MTTADRGSVRCVGGIIHDTAGRLLLIRRGHDPYRGSWSLPGGRVEPGETDEEALLRELVEETGLRVTVGRHCGSVRGGLYDIHDYACTVTDGDLRAGDDAVEVAWVDAATFLTLDERGALTPDLAETLRGWRMLPRS